MHEGVHCSITYSDSGGGGGGGVGSTLGVLIEEQTINWRMDNTGVPSNQEAMDTVFPE